MALTGMYAGDIQWAPFDISAYLYEGNISRGSVFVGGGIKSIGTAYAAEIQIGDIVEIFDDADISAEATKGLPVVRKATGAGAAYIGRVKEIFFNESVPSGSITDLGDMIAGGYLRLARVEILGLVGQALIEVTIPANAGGADSIDVGVPAGLVMDTVNKIWKFGTGTSNELIPLTHLEGKTDADVTGAVLVGVGLKKVQKVNA